MQLFTAPSRVTCKSENYPNDLASCLQFIGTEYPLWQEQMYPFVGIAGIETKGSSKKILDLGFHIK